MSGAFLKQLDRFLGKLAGLILFNSSEASSEVVGEPKRMAVIRLWAIGESLLALPAIAALKTQRPGAKITVITTPRVADVFRGQKFVDEIEVIQSNLLSFLRYLWRHRRTFDIAIDFEPYFYTSAFLARMIGKYSLGFNTLTRGRLYTKAVPYSDTQHVLKTNFDLVQAMGVEQEIPNTLISLPLTSSLPKFWVSPEFGRLRSLAPMIALAPGGGVDFRRWPADRFAQVADYLMEKCQCEVVLVGDEADEPILQRVQEKMKYSVRIVSNLSLPEVAQLLSQCRLTIANDGGLMHVSAAVGTPTLGLFGPEMPMRMGPYGPGNCALYHQLEDNPIINVSRGEVPGMLKTIGDPARYVRAISVTEVITSATEMLRRS